MHIFFTAILAGILIAVSVVLYLRWRRSHGTCASCGSSSQFGYSNEPESKAEDIVKLCFNCLAAKLADDYMRYESKALVIEPAAGFPCYVFQPKSKWADAKLAKDVTEMVSKPDETCNQCGSNAHYLWVASNGLNPATFEQVLSNGLSETLLRWGNPHPMSLCGRCCAKSVAKSIKERGLSFLEVCSPRSEDGYVIPMGY